MIRGRVAALAAAVGFVLGATAQWWDPIAAAVR